MRDPLLRVENLHTRFDTDRGSVHAVDGVSLTVGRSEVVGVLGESGSGKSVTARSICRLEDPGRIVDGTVAFDGTELTTADKSTVRCHRTQPSRRRFAPDPRADRSTGR